MHGISQAGILDFPGKNTEGNGLPFPSPGHLPDPGIEPGSPALQADTPPSEPSGKPHFKMYFTLYIVMCIC